MKLFQIKILNRGRVRENSLKFVKSKAEFPFEDKKTAWFYMACTITWKWKKKIVWIEISFDFGIISPVVLNRVSSGLSH